MKFAFRLASISLIILAICASVSAGEFFTTKTFSVTIPDGWSSKETADMMSLVGPNEVSNISASTLDSGGATIDQFCAVFADVMKEQLDGFKILASSRTKVDGAEAAVWVYSAKVEGVTVKFKNLVIFPDGQKVVYNVLFVTLPELYAGDVGAFDSMVKTWEWTGY